jgi:hypothetical protein
MPQTTFTNLILTQQISDHFPIFVLTNVTKIKKKKTLHTFTDFSANNIANFKANLANVNWDQATTSECPDIAYNSFHETFTNLHNLTTQDMIRLIGEQFWSQHWFNWSLSTIL